MFEAKHSRSLLFNDISPRPQVRTFDDVKIIPIRGGIDGLLQKRAFENFFHCAFLSSSSAHHLDATEFPRILTPGASVVVESPRYIVPLNKEQRAEFTSKITGMTQKLGLTQKPADEAAGVFVFS